MTLSKLSHPNSVSVFDFGEIDGVLFVAMEFLRGTTLSARRGTTALTPDEAASLMATLARAMHHAHSLGILHRDLKPDNVMITEDGTPKIVDWGLALEIGDVVDAPATLDRTILGTPAYMAPEQARGEIDKMGPAADVYALGATLYQMLTGQPPFRGRSTADVLRDVCHSAPVPPSKHNRAVPRDLESICMKCLEKEPGRRYQTAADLADDLERFRERLARREASPGIWGRLQRLVSLNRWTGLPRRDDR